MCQCTPEKRTPWCWKDDCRPPKNMNSPLFGMPANWPEEYDPDRTNTNGLIPVYRIKYFDKHFYTDNPEHVIKLLQLFRYAEIFVIDMLPETYRNIR